MNLPLVNVFSSPYEAWSTRNPTVEEMLEHNQKTGKMLYRVNVNLIARVCNALDAANYISTVGADNGLGSYINSSLDTDPIYKTWRDSMPSRTPKVLADYQKIYPNCDFSNVNSEINNNGHPLSEGQYLFHGGIWPGRELNTYETTRPFSTSLCPQVALRNAEYKAKAYDANQIDLIVLRATNPKTHVFSFRRAGTSMGHENEVLFASGAQLVKRERTLIRSDYNATKLNFPNKQINIYVLEVDIS